MQITRNSLETRRAERLVHRRGLPRLRRRAVGGDAAERDQRPLHARRAHGLAHHPNGQTIWVTEGIGHCQRRGGQVEVIRPGDRVFFEPARSTGTARRRPGS